MFKKAIVLVLLICGLLDTAVAQSPFYTMWWRGRKDEPLSWAVDTEWNNSDNWYVRDGIVRRPTREDVVSLNGGTWDPNVPFPDSNSVDPIIDSSYVGMDRAVCLDLGLPYWQEVNSTPCVLYVVDGVLEVERNFVIGVSNRCDVVPYFIDDGTLEMMGGTITVGHKLSVGGTGGWYCETYPGGEGGKGTINMTGGTITCGTFYIPEGNYADPNGGGTVNLDGGTIYADTFVMHPNDPCGSSGFMYITDGRLIIDGNQISLINGYATDPNNWISGGEPNWVIQAIYYSNMNTNLEDMDTTRVIARNPELAWTPYPKDDTVRIPENDVNLTWLAGTKASDVNGHDVYIGTNETDVNDANTSSSEYRGRQSATTYDTDPLPPVKGVTYYWRIDEVNNPAEIYKGRVWNYTVDDYRAYNPYPSDTATGATIEPNLSWMPGTDSNTHDVYFGTDFDEVNDANILTTGIFRGNYDVNSYDPGALLVGTTYYWRIDEVNTVTIKGHVWSFTTGDYFVVEDFDPYADHAALRAVWTTGHLANNGTELFLEKDSDFVRDGNSMRFYFRGLGKDQGAYVGSEAVADTTDLEVGTDWTASGAKALVLYFYGDPTNLDDTSGVIGGIHQDQMYVALEDGDSNGVVKYDTEHGYDMNDIKEASWHEWNIDLEDPCLSSVDMNNVVKVYIGFGGQKIGQTEKGAGKDTTVGDTVWFEDITLAASRCRPGYGPDLSGDCFVNYDDLEILFEPWLFKGYDVNAAEAISADPYVWYKFDETEGNEAEDACHPGNVDYTAIYMQDPCDTNDYDVDRIWDSTGGYDGNGCMVFGGSDANHNMEVPPEGWCWDMGDAEQITISTWVKGVVPKPDVWQTLFHAKKYGTSDEDDYWMMGQWRREEDFILSLFAADSAPPGSEDDWMVWQEVEDVTAWTHFAFVKNLNADEMIMYVDGMPVAMTTTNPNQHMDGYLVEVFSIGGPADRALMAADEGYDGSYLQATSVDDFRVYGKALSHPEILKLAGRESVHVGVVPLYLPGEPYADDKVDLKDYALIASHWFEEPKWPYRP